MENAAQLLRETRDSVAGIAATVGYENQSKFTAAFKETYGMLPTEYRKRHTG
jgi:AraC-like DNA-binding protein